MKKRSRNTAPTTAEYNKSRESPKLPAFSYSILSARHSAKVRSAVRSQRYTVRSDAGLASANATTRRVTSFLPGILPESAMYTTLTASQASLFPSSARIRKVSQHAMISWISPICSAASASSDFLPFSNLAMYSSALGQPSLAQNRKARIAYSLYNAPFLTISPHSMSATIIPYFSYSSFALFIKTCVFVASHFTSSTTYSPVALTTYEKSARYR